MKKRFVKLNFIKIRSFYSLKDTVKKMKRKPQIGRKYLQNTCDKHIKLIDFHNI